MEGSNTKAEDISLIQSNYSYREAEALLDEIDEENLVTIEVIRIGELLAHWQEMSCEESIFESLRRLQFMKFSPDIISGTKIDKVVSGLLNHRVERIRALASILIRGWSCLIDDWINSAAFPENTTNESCIEFCSDEFPCTEGLPIPPLDLDDLLATISTPFDLSNFFDGINEDEERKQRKTQTLELKDLSKLHLRQCQPKTKIIPAIQHVSKQQEEPLYERKKEMAKRKFRAGCHEANNERKRRKTQMLKLEDLPKVHLRQCQPKTKIVPAHVSKQHEELSYQQKMEMAKRKFREGYNEANNARNRRKTQMLEPEDLRGLHLQQFQPKAKLTSRSRKALSTPLNCC